LGENKKHTKTNKQKEDNKLAVIPVVHSAKTFIPQAMGCSHNSCVAKEKHDNSSKYKPQYIHGTTKDIIIAVEDPRSHEIIKEF